MTHLEKLEAQLTTELEAQALTSSKDKMLLGFTELGLLQGNEAAGNLSAFCTMLAAAEGGISQFKVESNTIKATVSVDWQPK